MGNNPENKRFNFQDWAHEQWKWGRVMDGISRDIGFRHLREPNPTTKPIRVNRDFPKVNHAIVRAVG